MICLSTLRLCIYIYIFFLMYLQGYICFEGEGDVVQLIVCPDWLNKKKRKEKNVGGGGQKVNHVSHLD